MSPPGDPLEPLRPYVANALPLLATPYVAGVVGDHPSTYSHSPALWHAAFAACGVPAAYVPFDVAAAHLEHFLATCRTLTALLGLNVTVPYKERVAALVDEMNPDVAACGAVNTVLRTAEGRLVGANTDGIAALQALQNELGVAPAGRRDTGVLVLGAGGAARAVGAAAAGVGYREILISTRVSTRGAQAVETIRRAGGRAAVVEEDGLSEALSGVGVVVNATPVGMAGPLQAEGGVRWLEPFSALGAAESPIDLLVGGALPPSPSARWWERAWPALARNLEESLRRALRLRSDARVLDLVYAPEESVTLKHTRWTGHRAANGRGVLLRQAVEAFLFVCRPVLEEKALERTRAVVTSAMASRGAAPR